MSKLGFDVRLDTMTGKIRFIGGSVALGEQEVGIGTVGADNGSSVDITFTPITAYGVNIAIIDNTLDVIINSREPVYSLDRVPPKCYVCGHNYAAMGDDERIWFREYLHHRHRTWMPVCQECTSPQMTLRH